MKIGLIGRSGSGRSTLFQAITGQAAGPAGASKTRLGLAQVKDPRVLRLTEMYKPKKTIFSEVTVALPPNPTTGPLDAASLREMRDLRAYALVIGAFASEAPEEQARAALLDVNTEMVLADMERVERRVANIRKGGGARPGESEVLSRAEAQLGAEAPLRLLELDEAQRQLLDELGLLSQRPLITVVNVAEDQAGRPVPPAVEEAAAKARSPLLWLCAPIEVEISALPPEAQPEFLDAYGLSQPAAHRFVQTCLDLLDLTVFFTVGPDEVRAWPIPRDAPARRAARTIHTDLERGFIRAEVIAYEMLLQYGSEAAVKAAGKLRMEGKDYPVQDGDIINIRFNV